MSIEPVAWTDAENVDMHTYGIEFQFPAHSTKLNESMVPLYSQSAIDELQRQLSEVQDLAGQINTDWIPANKRLAEQLEETKLDLKRAIKQRNDWDEANTLHIRKLAEREAVIERLREVYEAARQLLRYSGIDKDRTRDAADRLDDACEEIKKLDESDYTALDEAIKAAKVEVLEELQRQLAEAKEAAKVTRRMLCQIGIVGAYLGKDTILRESVLGIFDRFGGVK